MLDRSRKSLIALENRNDAFTSEFWMYYMDEIYTCTHVQPPGKEICIVGVNNLYINKKLFRLVSLAKCILLEPLTKKSY